MRNPIVGAMVDGLAQHGMSTLRFNFPGVGASGGSIGSGSEQAVSGARAFLKAQSGATWFVVGGYSFGTMTAIRYLDTNPGEFDAAVLTTPPPYSSLSKLDIPLLLIIGENDGISNGVESLSLKSPGSLRYTIPGAGHFNIPVCGIMD